MHEPQSLRQSEFWPARPAVAIAFMTRDRIDQTRRVVEPLLQPELFDLFWIDGSEEHKSQTLPARYSQVHRVFSNVRQGPDAAVVYALTQMLADPGYAYVGIVENDVLMKYDWFPRTMQLFDIGATEGLKVGAVSARAYEDRILTQRDGYAVMHNLGYGMIIMTRNAARCYLDRLRTGWTFENRRTFQQLCGCDIGLYWAFRNDNHMICADWNLDRILAENGYVSLALTPSPIEMVGQKMPLGDQGLCVAEREVDELRGNTTFRRLVEGHAAVRAGDLVIGERFARDSDKWSYFPHQLHQIGGSYEGKWELEWAFGCGPFAWRAAAPSRMIVKLFGPSGFFFRAVKPDCYVAVHIDGKAHDLIAVARSEGEIIPTFKIDSSQLSEIAIDCPEGVVFHVLDTAHPQAYNPRARFDYHVLP